MDLSVLHQRIMEKKRLEAELSEVQHQIRTMEILLPGLKEEADAEQADVDRMESGGIVGALYSLFGSREDRLQQEMDEAAAAKQKYMDALYTIQNLQKQKEDLSAQISLLGKPEYEYEEAFRRNQQALDSDPGPQGTEYRRLKQEMTALRNTEKEIREAEIAGERVISAVEDIEKSLRSASGWGMVDMFTDSFFSDMAKYGSMDEAKRKFRNLQTILRQYSKELRDLNLNLDISLDIGGGLQFADFFFDNIFTDIMARNRIEDMKRQIQNVRTDVMAYHEIIKRKERSLRSELEARKSKAEDLIIRYRGG